MPDAPHHSIGEVLSLLKEEHADITIAKIRFLESQGLIEPERTPSGYRKFYDTDIERLRWILSQQRDNFLPLKVIKRRLGEAGFDPASEAVPRDPDPVPEPSLFSHRDEQPDPAVQSTHDPSSASAKEAPGEKTEALVDLRETDVSAPTASPPPSPPSSSPPPIVGSVSLTLSELAEAAGVDIGFLGELEKLGLIEAMATGTGKVFDHEALLVAKASERFRRVGLEARHLRMFKVAADRETGVLDQLVGHKIRRGGATQQEGFVELSELVDLGQQIRLSILRRNLGAPLDG